jgi:hypothetical protein
VAISEATCPLVCNPCLTNILPVAWRNHEHSQHEPMITARLAAYHASA